MKVSFSLCCVVATLEGSWDNDKQMEAVCYLYSVNKIYSRCPSTHPPQNTSKLIDNKSCQKPTIELAGRLREKLNISP